MNDRIEIACEIRHETKSAYLIFDGQTTAWIPKSTCDEFVYDGPGKKTGQLAMDERIAKQKGLI